MDNRGNLRGSASNAGVSLSIQGANELLRISKALKSAGQKGLRNEFHATVRTAAKPLVPKVKQAARDKFPSKGGINEHYAKKKYSAVTRTGAKTAGVRIVGAKLDPRTDATGRVAHPIFGRKGKAKNKGKNMAVQTIPQAKGFFSGTLEAGAAQAQVDIARAMTEFMNRTIREGS